MNKNSEPNRESNGDGSFLTHNFRPLLWPHAPTCSPGGSVCRPVSRLRRVVPAAYAYTAGSITRAPKSDVNSALCGLLTGLIAVALVLAGNPANMGFCIACFLRDTAGALGLHEAEKLAYVRPEIPGLVLGSCAAALCFREFRPKGGSSPMLRFVIGFFVMVGALMFLGCPLRMALRLAAGDLNALTALFGFAAGVGIGVVFLKNGYTLGPSREQNRPEGLAFPALQLALLMILVLFPTLLSFSAEGPGSLRAPLLLSLAAGLTVGFLAQRSRLCMAGGLRDVMLFGDGTLLLGFAGIFIGALALNLLTGQFHLGFEGQPVAHSDHLWNFLGMALTGLGSVMLGGCPLRQLILAGEGNTDSAMAVLGMVAGAAACHNFGLASSAEGATSNGKIAVALGLLVLLLLALLLTLKGRKSHAN